MFIRCVEYSQLQSCHLCEFLNTTLSLMTSKSQYTVSQLTKPSVLRVKPLHTKRRTLYLKTQSVPRCKHFSSRL
jgi:hypothetical protein